MIVYNIKKLLKKKSTKDNKKYTYQDIEKATGIKRLQLSRINSTPDYNITGTHIEKLCRYFNCSPNDLITIYDETTPKKYNPTD